MMSRSWVLVIYAEFAENGICLMRNGRTRVLCGILGINPLVLTATKELH